MKVDDTDISARTEGKGNVRVDCTDLSTRTDGKEK